jgi:hypothetical protein
LDAVASRLDCCFALIHHASKGNQANKSVVDIGAGAGAQSRAADTHLVLRPHKEDGAVVLEAGLRSWPPVDPFALEWTFPTWNPSDLNPRDLRQPTPRRSTKPDKPEAPEEPKPTYAVENFASDFLTGNPQRDLVIIERSKAKVGAERQARRFLALAESKGLAHRWVLPKDRKVYFANTAQPVLPMEAEA